MRNHYPEYQDNSLMQSKLPVRYTDLYPNICFPLSLSTMLRLEEYVTWAAGMANS